MNTTMPIVTRFSRSLAHFPKRIWARLLLFFAFLLASIVSEASLMWSPELAQAYDSVLALKMVRARELLDQERTLRPDNGLILYVEDLMDFVTLLATENRSEYGVIKKRQDQRLNQLEREPATNPWQRYARAEVLIHWALLQIKFEKSVVGSALDLRRSYKLLKENEKLYPAFLPNGKSLGMMQLIVGTTPGSYKWLLGLLGIRATVPEGMANLMLAVKSKEPQRVEAALFLANAYTYILKQPEKGTHILDSLYQTDRHHVVMGFFYSGALIKDGRGDSAFTVLRSLPRSFPTLPLYFISYQMGNILLYRGEYAEAIRYYTHFTTYYQGESNLVDSWYKMYLAATLMGDKARAELYKKRGLAIDLRVTEADKHAQKQLKRSLSIEPTLMKARLNCDGGYHKEAKALLLSLGDGAYTGIEQKAEYWYRLGRVYSGLNAADSSAVCYQKAITTGGDAELYFLPNAALELGYYYKDKKNKAEARKWLEKALDYPGNEYTEGIERKAKAALDNLDQGN